ncbi:MAG: hypothetical protein P4L50_27805 [Anaerolineaceae bacterium]|nr:hypothetical protein [Anaerolineaceae bacterium]
MTLPSARITIPVEWGKSAHCPICGTSPLTIIHPYQRPDEFQCAGCGAEFELEQGGSRIWLNILPHNLFQGLAGHWVSIDEVKAEVQKLNQPLGPLVEAPASDPITYPAPDPNASNPGAIFTVPITTITPKPPAPAAPDAQLVAQARELYALGNSVSQIRAILGRTKGVKSEELDAILAEVTHLDRKKHNRQTRNLFIAAFVSLIIVSCFLAVVYATTGTLPMFPKTGQSANSTAVPNPVSIFNLAILPNSMKTLVPSGMTISNPYPPVIIKGSQSDSATYTCPTDASQAADLFGGLKVNWSYDQGWIMVSKSPANLHVPAGMTAGYIYFSPDMQMKSVNGPVTIQNINMLIISCE